MAAWTLTVRDGPRFERRRFGELGEALDALEARVEELHPKHHRDEVQFMRRTIEPSRQVSARAEIFGPQRFAPSVRGGVDLRGDGSSEAFTGKWRRRLVEQRRGENAVAALRRALED
jgi:hypothetical protein